MTVAKLIEGSGEFRRLLDAVSRELVTSQIDRDAAFIQTPLSYPGGSSVVVRVSQDAQGYFVTDFGTGLDEALAMGIPPATYSRYAHEVADAIGVRFDNHAFFTVNATREQLAGAIVAVANASHSTVFHTLFGVADKTGQMEAQLFDRLRKAFQSRNAKVEKQAEIKGYSNTGWKVDALVRSGDKVAVFDFVTKHPASVAATTTKYYDLARLRHAPARVAVVKNKAELGTYLNVLSQAANVVEDSVPDATLVKLALAA